MPWTDSAWVWLHPWILIVGLPLVVLAWLLEQYWVRGFKAGAPKKSRVFLRFSWLAGLSHAPEGKSLRLRRWVVSLRWLSIACLIVAAARPQAGRKQANIHSEGIDIVLAVDTSGSMRALDLDTSRSIANRKNRLQVTLDVVARFIEARPNDQIGMVVFGGHAFTQCPLTLDHGIVSALLQEITIGIAGDQTAVGSALATATRRLKNSKAKSKVVILLTDGRNNAGTISPKQAAEIAQAMGVRVYTIGAGSRQKAPFIVDGLFGKDVVYQNVEIDEATLKQIAEITGGAYFRAEDAKGLQDIYSQIDALEKTEIEIDAYMEFDEKFSVWLVLALLLLACEQGLLRTRLRMLP